MIRAHRLILWKHFLFNDTFLISSQAQSRFPMFLLNNVDEIESVLALPNTVAMKVYENFAYCMIPVSLKNEYK